MMTFKDDAVHYGRMLLRWVFGVFLIALGSAIVLEKLTAAGWGLACVGGGGFILFPSDVKAYGGFLKDFVTGFPTKPGGGT